MPDQYFDNAERWHAELAELRSILLAHGLQETLKWRQPCYMAHGRNVVILGGFKAACRLNFFDGASLDDPGQRLISPGENSRSGRFLAFTSVDQIRAERPAIDALIDAAVALAQQGRPAAPPPAAEPPRPQELLDALAADPQLATAFDALTPGRRRGYLLHFAGAKRSASRTARIERCRDRILAGKGLQDCICGHSKRMPRCDGSHKHH